jgi:DNA-binding NarL/FixJ family response regulator
VRVLVVDDSAVSRSAFARAAVAAGLDVACEAADAEAAVELALRLEIDAVVIDGRLPGGAIACIERLHGVRPGLALYVVGALDETALVRSAMAAGAAGALLRPVLSSQLARTFAMRTNGEDAS